VYSYIFWRKRVWPRLGIRTLLFIKQLKTRPLFRVDAFSSSKSVTEIHLAIRKYESIAHPFTKQLNIYKQCRWVSLVQSWWNLAFLEGNFCYVYKRRCVASHIVLQYRWACKRSCVGLVSTFQRVRVNKLMDCISFNRHFIARLVGTVFVAKALNSITDLRWCAHLWLWIVVFT
jgi:hypothetical protein